MAERSISSRPSMEQVIAIVDFMEKHASLGLGQLRGLEGREESKKLWHKLSKIVNSLPGPTRPMKSWIKYWADKKSTVRTKVISVGGDSNSLSSNIDKRIWDLFLCNNSSSTGPKKKTRSKVKQEEHFIEDAFLEDDEVLNDHSDLDPVLKFDVPIDMEERQMAVMEKLVSVMGAQAAALSASAGAAQRHALALERLAEASQIQARAIERLANSFEGIGASTHGVHAAIVEIDGSLKRLYNAAPT